MVQKRRPVKGEREQAQQQPLASNPRFNQNTLHLNLHVRCRRNNTSKVNHEDFFDNMDFEQPIGRISTLMRSIFSLN